MEKTKESIWDSIPEEVLANIKTQGVANVIIAHSKLGGLSRTDYVKLMGKPAKLATVLDAFSGMAFCSTNNP